MPRARPIQFLISQPVDRVNARVSWVGRGALRRKDGTGICETQKNGSRRRMIIVVNSDKVSWQEGVSGFLKGLPDGALHWRFARFEPSGRLTELKCSIDHLFYA